MRDDVDRFPLSLLAPSLRSTSFPFSSRTCHPPTAAPTGSVTRHEREEKGREGNPGKRRGSYGSDDDTRRSERSGFPGFLSLPLPFTPRHSPFLLSLRSIRNDSDGERVKGEESDGVSDEDTIGPLSRFFGPVLLVLRSLRSLRTFHTRPGTEA